MEAAGHRTYVPPSPDTMVPPVMARRRAPGRSDRSARHGGLRYGPTLADFQFVRDMSDVEFSQIGRTTSVLGCEGETSVFC